MMKYINIITYLFISVLICSSCKNDEAFDFPGDAQNRIYFKTVENTVNGYDKLSIGAFKTERGVFCTELQLPVYSTEPADGDIYVSVRINQNMVDDYNSDNGTDYSLFPVDALSIVNNNLRIPSNSMCSEGSFGINIDDEKLGTIESGVYLLPLTLSEVSGNAALSSNRSTVYLFIELSIDEDNIWDVTPENKGVFFTGERSEWDAEAFNSTFSGEPTPMFDGDEYTSVRYSLQFEEDNEYSFIVDMQDKIGSIAGIYEKFDSRYQAILKSDIYTSLDNETWTYQGEYIASDETSEIMFYGLIEARYIKIVIKEPRYSYQINEFNIYVKNN